MWAEQSCCSLSIIKWEDHLNNFSLCEHIHREPNSKLMRNIPLVLHPGQWSERTAKREYQKKYPIIAKISSFFLDAIHHVGFLSPPTQHFTVMSRICSIRGSHVRSGGRIHRSGLAKKKGGIGRHVTKVVKRKVSPNLQNKRIWVPEFGHYVRLKLSCKAIKTITKNGALNTLMKAGLV
jgi:large subunit ribosomal protein L28